MQKKNLIFSCFSRAYAEPCLGIVYFHFLLFCIVFFDDCIIIFVSLLFVRFVEEFEKCVTDWKRWICILSVKCASQSLEQWCNHCKSLSAKNTVITRECVS